MKLLQMVTDFAGNFSGSVVDSVGQVSDFLVDGSGVLVDERLDESNIHRIKQRLSRY